jgi:hypothetical protein
MPSQSYQLVMRSGPNPQKAYDLSLATLTIGRDLTNDIVINDSEVSRKHARLTAQAGSFLLEDLGSTNGTFVNGQRLLGPHLLRPGELILVGENVSFSFEELAFDPDATVVAPVSLPPYQVPPAGREPYVAPLAQSSDPYTAPPEPMPSPRPTYIPPGAPPAMEPPIPPAQPGKNRAGWIIGGLSCLIVVLCLCIGAAWVFDTLNLYCLPPFDSLFSFLYTCP